MSENIRIAPDFKLRVILADDEPVARRLLRRNLCRSAPNVEVVGEASNGYELLSLLESVTADMVLLDIMMPGLNGLEAFKRLGRKAEELKVIIVSAYDRFEFAQEALNLGAFAYLLKPVRPSELKQSIRKCASKIMEERAAISSRVGLPGSVMDGRAADELQPLVDADESSTRRLLMTAKSIIEQRAHEKLTLSDVAAEVFISPWHLSRLFKHICGINFHDYLTKIRIDRAKALLRDTQMSCMAVGQRVGYDSPSYFSQVFKQITGMSPTEFRQRSCHSPRQI